MAVYMKVHCGHCGKIWEIYERDKIYSLEARTCPHCCGKVDEQIWKHEIIPGFKRMAAANRELQKDHIEYNPHYFAVDVISNNDLGIPEYLNKY
jgi:hypothetical protein